MSIENQTIYRDATNGIDGNTQQRAWVNKTPQFQVYYQKTTRNRSFLEMHYYLKKIGIKNNAFMLTLLDPDLAGVDPYDPALTRIMKVKILRECTYNYWYFIREVVRVPTTGKPQGAMYGLHRGNMALSFCLLHNLNIFFELPRQQGKSIAADIWYLYVYNFATANAEITFLNKSMKDSKLNLGRLKDLRDALPSYLQMSQEFSIIGDKKKKLTSTVETIQHPINHNIIKTAPSARNQMSAANLLRGRTITCLWADEWAFIPYNDIIYSNTIPALRTAFINAAAARSPYGILLTTTPGILSSSEGKYAYQMLQDATIFTERWYDKSPMEIMSIIASNRNSNFVYVKFNYKQVGRSEQWFEETCKEMLFKWRDIRREILLEWSDSPENCPFTQEDLEAIEQMVHEPIAKVEFLHQYILNIYERIPLRPDMIPKNPPIMGVDVSGGYKRDSSAITIIDSATTKVIADFKCNYISPIDLARLVLAITETYYPNAVINIERNGGFGASVVAKLKESKAKKNLYFEIKDRIVEEQNDGIRIIRKKQRTKVFGLDSTKDVRDNLIEILRERVDLHKDKFISPSILNEMKGMEIKRSGKVEHSDTTHDDQVFSYLMALYVWYEGKNLKELFNINKHTIKTENNIDDTVTGLDEQYTSVIEEIEPIDKADSPEREQTMKDLKEMQKAHGMLFDQFMALERKKEEAMLSQMLTSKVIREAYTKQLGVPLEDIDAMRQGESNIPDSVFANFNSDTEMDEQKRLKENMNFANFPRPR